MALNPFNAGLPEGPGSGHFGEINCADCPAIELPPPTYQLSLPSLLLFRLLGSGWFFSTFGFFSRRVLSIYFFCAWHLGTLSFQASWKANWKISMAKLLHAHTEWHAESLSHRVLANARTSSLPFDGCCRNVAGPWSLLAPLHLLQCVCVMAFSGRLYCHFRVAWN